MKGVAILGSTGSIGVSTLDVIARHPGDLRVVALTAQANESRLFEQCCEHRPELAVLVDETAARRLTERLRAVGVGTRVLGGAAALEEAARHPDAECVMAAIVGGAGLLPTLAAARAGKRLLLANKESVVMAGALLIDAVRASGAALIPIDSEHNAIFQCLPGNALPGERARGVRRIVLTASGGPFLRTPASELARVTPEAACAHPRWVMGRKISVDSATLMNKGLELIEACRLFGVAPEDVEVVVHPQSVVHSMVQYVDGSTLAQLGNPDMRTPIAHALAWPERCESGAPALDIVATARLTFEAPDLERFPSLGLAQQAARAGGTAPILLNAANEIAVAAFLARRLNFGAIPVVIEGVLDRVATTTVRQLDDVLAADAEARRAAEQGVARLAGLSPDPVAGACA
jgi:1-deoxy-D-xylulose-5-phosphate reductoisomerase